MATEPGPDVAEALFQAHHASTPAPVFLAPSMVSPLPSVHVLIVCAGNVRRSPIAAALWRHKFREQPMWVQSAGLNALNGCGINPRAESVLTQHGLTGRPHIARQVTAGLVEEADIVLTMDGEQAVAVQELSKCAPGRTFTLGKWSGGIEIPDPHPYTTDAYLPVYRLIERAVDDWHEQLNGCFVAATKM